MAEPTSSGSQNKLWTNVKQAAVPGAVAGLSAFAILSLLPASRFDFTKFPRNLIIRFQQSSEIRRASLAIGTITFLAHLAVSPWKKDTEGELQRTKVAAAALQADVASLRGKVAQFKADTGGALAGAKAQLDAAVEAIGQHAAGTQAELQAARANLAQARQQIGELKAAASGLEQVRGELAAAREKTDGLQANEAKFERQIAKLHREAGELRDRAETSEAATAGLRRKLQRAEQAKAGLEQVRSELAAARREADGLRAEGGERLAAAEARCAELQVKAEGLEAENGRLQQQIVELREAVHREKKPLPKPKAAAAKAATSAEGKKPAEDDDASAAAPVVRPAARRSHAQDFRFRKWACLDKPPASRDAEYRGTNSDKVQAFLLDYEGRIKALAREAGIDHLPLAFVREEISSLVEVYKTGIEGALDWDPDQFDQRALGELREIVADHDNLNHIREKLRHLKAQADAVETPAALRARFEGRLRADHIGMQAAQQMGAAFEEVVTRQLASSESLGDLDEYIDQACAQYNARQLAKLEGKLKGELDDAKAARIMGNWALIGQDVRYNRGVLSDQRIAALVAKAKHIDAEQARFDDAIAALEKDLSWLPADETVILERHKDIAELLGDPAIDRHQYREKVAAAHVQKMTRNARALLPSEQEQAILSALGFKVDGEDCDYQDHQLVIEAVRAAIGQMGVGQDASLRRFKGEVEQSALMARLKIAGVPESEVQRYADQLIPALMEQFSEREEAMSGDAQVDTAEVPGLPADFRLEKAKLRIRQGIRDVKRRWISNHIRKSIEGKRSQVLDGGDLETIFAEDIRGDRRVATHWATHAAETPHWKSRIEFYRKWSPYMSPRHEAIQGFMEDPGAILQGGRCAGESYLAVRQELENPALTDDQLAADFNVQGARMFQALQKRIWKQGNYGNQQLLDCLQYTYKRFFRTELLSNRIDAVKAGDAASLTGVAKAELDAVRRDLAKQFVDQMKQRQHELMESHGTVLMHQQFFGSAHAVYLRIDQGQGICRFRDPNIGRVSFPVVTADKTWEQSCELMGDFLGDVFCTFFDLDWLDAEQFILKPDATPFWNADGGVAVHRRRG